MKMEMKVFCKLQILVQIQEIVEAFNEDQWGLHWAEKQWWCRPSSSAQTQGYLWVKGIHVPKKWYHWGMTTFASASLGKTQSHAQKLYLQSAQDSLKLALGK